MRTGESGENTAEKYLKKKGHIIIERNFRCRKGEIDIISRISNIIVFVEVKTRHTLKYGVPAESITQSKIKNIKAAARWFIHANSLYEPELDFRFDVVEILRQSGRQYVRHTENAFQ